MRTPAQIASKAVWEHNYGGADIEPDHHMPEDEYDCCVEVVFKSIDSEKLAAFIRAFDGKHDKGAAELADAIMEWLTQ